MNLISYKVKNDLRLFFSSARKGSLKFAKLITSIVNFILLFFVYFIGIGLTSFFAKIFNKKFLDIKDSKEKDTYWLDLNLKKRDIQEYYRQF